MRRAKRALLAVTGALVLMGVIAQIASAAYWTNEEGAPLPEGTTIGLSGTLGLKYGGLGGINCSINGPMSVYTGDEAEYDAAISGPSCSGSGVLSGCAMSKGEASAPWQLQAGDDRAVQSQKIHWDLTLAGSCPFTKASINGELKMTPDNPEAISTFAITGTITWEFSSGVVSSSASGSVELDQPGSIGIQESDLGLGTPIFTKEGQPVLETEELGFDGEVYVIDFFANKTQNSFRCQAHGQMLLEGEGKGELGELVLDPEDCTGTGLFASCKLEAGEAWASGGTSFYARGDAAVARGYMLEADFENCSIPDATTEGDIVFTPYRKHSILGFEVTQAGTTKTVLGSFPSGQVHGTVLATPSWVFGIGLGLDTTVVEEPTATTESATGVNATAATFHGKIDPHGSATAYRFEYGKTTSYGSAVPSSPEGIGSGSGDVSLSKSLSGLQPSTTYHYRLSAIVGESVWTGEDKTFTTEALPQTTITSPTPSYTSNEKYPVKFSSSKSGSTFKCSLTGKGSGESFSDVSCTSPRELLSEVGPGWHTFSVVATDANGNVDPTPATWGFNPDLYPPAPATSKMVTPEDGTKSASYYALRAEWGAPPKGESGVSGVTFQFKTSNMDRFVTIPAGRVRDASGNEVSWPLPVSANPGKSEPVFFKAKDFFYSPPGHPTWNLRLGEARFRAVFDGSPGAAGASEPVTTRLNKSYPAPGDATAQLGPATVDLLAGSFAISRTDVSIPVPGSDSNLEFTRTYESTYHGQKVPTKVMGGPWQPSAPVEAAAPGEGFVSVRLLHQDEEPAVYDEECEEEGASPAECMIEEAIPASDWAEVLDSEGPAASFDYVGGKYVSPEYAQDWTLSREDETHLVLADSNGTHTVFTKNEVGYTNEYRATSVSMQATPKAARMVYSSGGSGHRLEKVIAPATPGVTCSDSTAIETAGCRVLKLSYLPGETWGATQPWWKANLMLASITYYNGSGNKATAQTVAEYKYDPSGRLIEEWDPRISPELAETYAYSGYRMTSLTPPGEEPWKFGYYSDEGSPLRSVSRATLATPSTAQTTLIYGVPLEGEDAPYEMGPQAVAEWGQTDYPVDATAIFGPNEIPDTGIYRNELPSDYDSATVHYMDPEGNEVNTASPPLPGASGPSVTTSETDVKGNVIRSLGAQNRLLALAAEDPVVRSRELDSHSVYSSDGTEMLESWGPLHEVRLESGETVQARSYTKVEYDAGYEASTAPAGTPWPHLPTKETSGAVVPGKAGTLEQSTAETKYDWSLRKPTEQVLDPGSGHLNLRTVTAYDTATGQPIEERTPAANAEGSDAHTTKTVYYSAGTSATTGCGAKPEWAGLTCVIKPAAAPSPSGGRPPVPWKWFTQYSSLDLPTEYKEKTEEGAVRRTGVFTYDAAGRPETTKVTGEGTALPGRKTNYDEATGVVSSVELICELESCTGFDAQKITTEYDSLGRPVEYEDADGVSSTVAYDWLGNAQEVTDGKGYQEFGYDPDSNMLIEVWDSTAGAFSASYDADGQLVEQVLPNGLAQQITYSATGSPVALRYQKVSGCATECTWLQFERKLSIGGKVLKQVSNLSEQEYSYDQAGRLTLVKDREGGNCVTRAYGFDADSNRTSMTTRSPGTGGACDTSSTGSKKSYEYDSADRLIGAGVEYDGLSRITSLPAEYSGGGKLTTSYYVNNLTRSQTQDGVTNTYSLDANYRQRERVESGAKSGTQIYHYAGDGDSPAWTDEGAGWTRSISALGGALGAIEKSSGETTLQLADMHGDVVATASLSPSATKLLSTSQFDEFGNPKQPAFAEYGWLGAGSRRTQLASGVVQMGLRSYVPALGRFLTPDPVRGGSANSYDYAGQDPVNNYDLTGEKFCVTVLKKNLCGYDPKSLQKEVNRRLLQRGKRLLRGKTGVYAKFRRTYNVYPGSGPGSGSNGFVGDLASIGGQALAEAYKTANAVMQTMACGAYAATGRFKACAARAEERIMSKIGPTTEMAAGCVEKLVPAWGDKADIKGLPTEMAKAIRKGNWFMLAASCGSGALGGP